MCVASALMCSRLRVSCPACAYARALRVWCSGVGGWWVVRTLVVSRCVGLGSCCAGVDGDVDPVVALGADGAAERVDVYLPVDFEGCDRALADGAGVFGFGVFACHRVSL